MEPLILFETERVIVRRLLETDVKAMVSVYGDREAMRWVGDGEPLDETECQRWVQVTHNNYVQRGYGMSTLVLRASGEIIGFCGIVHPGGQSMPEIKYALHRTYWGQGYATEVVKAMLHYGATAFGLQTIIATTAPANSASQHVLGKAGMTSLEDRHEEDGSITKVFAWQNAKF